MNVSDAKIRGIQDDDLVRVYNDRGEMVLPAYVTSRIVPGLITIHHGAWYVPGEEKTEKMPDGVDQRGCPNILTGSIDLPDTVVSGFPIAGLVEIEKCEAK